MKEIIQQIVSDFYSKVCGFFERDQIVNLGRAEKELSEHVNHVVCYLAALAIFKSLRRKGVISDSELVKIDSFLAEKFSASLAAKTPELACINIEERATIRRGRRDEYGA